jgi:putative ABC transport system permease protein
MWKYAWREIIRRKGRSIAAICSYALAAMIFSVLISLLQYSERSQYKTLYNTGTHFIAFSPVCCNLPLLKDETHEGFWANGSRSSIMPINLIDTIKKLPTVRDASPLLMFRFKDSTNNAGIIASGFDPENTISVANTTCSSTDLVSGRFITSHDTNTIIVEESFAYSHKIAVGKSLNIAGTSLLVVGIVNAGIRPVKSDIYMSFTQAERIISRQTWNPLKDEMNIILVESANAKVHDQAVQNVKSILGKDKIVSSYSCHNPAAEAINLNHHLLWLVIIFITVFIIVHVIRNHYASIIERKREIGILQSMGWTRKRTVLVVGYELILQALLGGILGGYLAIICQIAIPASKSSCHILCAIDSYGNALIGLGIVLTIATLSALSFVFCIARLQPMKNLKTV